MSINQHDVLVYNNSAILRYDDESKRLYFGLHPPAARAIDVDDGMKALIESFLTLMQSPSSINHVAETIAESHNVPRKFVLDVATELYDAGLLVRPRDFQNPLDRHQRYFSLYGKNAQSYRAVVSHAKIGIIGLGGLGSTVLLSLAAAGVTNFVVSDGDAVEPSNLTRGVLFRSEHVGMKKIDAARAELSRMLGEKCIETVDSQMNMSALGENGWLQAKFSDCDYIILTADKPYEIKHAVADFCIENGIPLANAFYVETIGHVPPTYIPGVSACVHCYEAAVTAVADVMPRGILFEGRDQIPSFGPLNMLLASLVASECLNFLMKIPLKTANRGYMFNLHTLECSYIPAKPLEGCKCYGTRGDHYLCHRTDDTHQHVFGNIADYYLQERSGTSLNKRYVDPVIESLIPECERVQRGRALDVGAGTGEYTSLLLSRGYQVDALEPSNAFFAALRERFGVNDRVNLHNEPVERWDAPTHGYDLVIASLILDHVHDANAVLNKLAATLPHQGRLIIVMPSPIKDSIRKDAQGGLFVDYRYEGVIEKQRFDSHGNVIAQTLTYKHSLNKVFGALSSAGLCMTLYEDIFVTDDAYVGSVPGAYIRVPYFTVTEWTRR